jgi:hypothetical protein|tara:strand:+ start:6771 stop:7781 length:1011 start_codon:yes stop_codon:yes gene_type:complete
MSLYIDHKYANLLSARLARFARKSRDLYNFRCPICGDSQKNLYKARGYLFNKKNKLIFKCHNCGTGGSIKFLLDKLDPSLSRQYSFENYKEEKGTPLQQEKVPIFRKPVFKHDPAKIDAPKIIDLPPDHPAVKFCDVRMLPKVRYDDMYFADCFKTWVSNYDVELAARLKVDDPRIIIPFFSKDRKLIAAQGRSLDNNTLRYFTIKIDKSAIKIFGLDRIKDDELIYIVEGPFDSMFLPNCLAMAGSDLDDASMFYAKNVVFVYDNEPRNTEIVLKIEKSIKKGFAVCIWPDTVKFKDINDMVLGEMDILEIIDIINMNTYRGLPARIKFNQWKRI